MEVWGQWIFGDKTSEKFLLTYAGQPSLFEGKTTLPEGVQEVKLEILAADQAQNFGMHCISFRIVQ